jgi:phage tail P2-like protein
MTYNPSIQPDNRTGLQHALENLLDNCMARIEADAPFRTLLFPLETPAQYLPALAIEKGVLDWAPDDEVGGVRKTVADGLIIQSHACTRQGIADSLAALGIDVVITHTGPYALSVKAMLSDAELDEDTMQRILARINAYKAERDKTDLQLIRQCEVTAFVGVVAQQGTRITIGPHTAKNIDATITGYRSVGAHAITRINIPATGEL